MACKASMSYEEEDTFMLYTGVEGELELTGDGLYTLPRHMRRRIRACHMRRRILPVIRGGGYMPATLPCHMRRRIHACYRQACECWQSGLCTQIIIYKGKYDLHRKVLLPSPVALPSHTSTTCSRPKRTHSSKRTHASNTSTTCSRSRSITSALSYDANTTTPS